MTRSDQSNQKLITPIGWDKISVSKGLMPK
jgi:hypothetical protein